MGQARWSLKRSAPTPISSAARHAIAIGFVVKLVIPVDYGDGTDIPNQRAFTFFEYRLGAKFRNLERSTSELKQKPRSSSKRPHS